MSMLSVPEGSWSGASDVPAPHLMRAERGRVPASRSTRRDVCRADATKISRRENVLRLVTAYDRDASPYAVRKNILFLTF